MNLFDIAKNPDQQIPDNVLEGFRLYKLEVYNWGTFDKKVWAFTPNGETALLTGEVGSGKSTLVDALTTLFVNPRKIAYNKAADATAKERTVASYVRGYYGQKRTDDGREKPGVLREPDQYSVLLATFKDEFLEETVTIAQFFWFRGDPPVIARFYVVADEELFITRDFSKFNADVKLLRAALKNRNMNVFDDYASYSQCYYKKLGGLDAKAVDLFSRPFP